MSVTYRKLDARNDDDFKLFLSMEDGLDDYLKTNISEIDLTKKHLWTRVHMGAVEFLDELVPGKNTTEYKKQLLKRPDQVCYVAEDDGKVVGYIVYLNYCVMNDERLGEEYGNLNAILVKENYRGTGVAYQLLQLALNDLINNGKTKLILTVQQDNPNRFLHFAMADTVFSQDFCIRRDGTKTNSYNLLISDAEKLKNMSGLELARKAANIKRKINLEKLEEPVFLQE